MPAPVPMTTGYTLLAASSAWLSTLLATGGAVSTPALSCIVAGVFGGAITQLLTIDARKPTKKVIVGEIMCSGLSGLGTFAYFDNHLALTIVISAVAGGAGAWLWHAAIDMIQEWFSKWRGPKP